VSKFLVQGPFSRQDMSEGREGQRAFGDIFSRTNETMTPLCITREGWLVGKALRQHGERKKGKKERRDPGAHAGDLMVW
jgi:hypothetical protein